MYYTICGIVDDKVDLMETDYETVDEAYDAILISAWRHWDNVTIIEGIVPQYTPKNKLSILKEYYL